MTKAPIRRAIELLGSEDKLAVAAGYSQRAIHYAAATGHVSPQMAYRIHAATRGRVKYVDLCPLLDVSRQLKLARAQVNGSSR